LDFAWVVFLSKKRISCYFEPFLKCSPMSLGRLNNDFAELVCGALVLPLSMRCASYPSLDSAERRSEVWRLSMRLSFSSILLPLSGLFESSCRKR